MSETTAKETIASADPRRQVAPGFLRRLVRGQEIGIFLVLLAMIVVFTLLTVPDGKTLADQKFLTSINIQNILLNFSWTAIAAFGATMVIITAGIDLSVGSVMALAGLATAWLISPDTSPFLGGAEVVPGAVIPLAVLVGLGVGALCGLMNGFWITVAGLPPFIATLGMLQIARGITYGWSQGWPIQRLPTDFTIIGRHNFPIGSFNLPLPTLIMVIIAVIAWLFMTRTVWGYRIFAVGGNEQAARLSGINTHRTKLLVYTIAGLLGGAGGYELDVIAAVVVGGSSLMGGEGSILGTLIGAAIMGVLRTGLNLAGVPAYWLPAAQGTIIILAITLDQWYRRRRGARVSISEMLAGWLRSGKS